MNRADTQRTNCYKYRCAYCVDMRIKFNDDSVNKKLCGSCTACCEYVNIPIPTPKTEEDFDHILWYVLHKNVCVWIGKRNKWNIKFDTPCKPLKNGHCNQYHTRPLLCREYSQKKCERNNPVSEVVQLFHNQNDLLAYLRKKRKSFFGFYE